MSLETPELSGLDMDSLLSRLDLSLSVEGLQSLTGSLLEGYQEYASSHPEADYSHLGETFMGIPADGHGTPDAGRLSGKHPAGHGDLRVSGIPGAADRDVMAGFQEYALANGMTDPDRFSEYLAAYLETPEAQQLIAEGASQVIQITGEPDLSPERLQACAEALLDGYQEYAVAGGLPDPSKMGEHFSAYLQTPEGQQRLMEGLQETINMEVLQQQIGSALEEYMTAAVGTYSSAMARILESQIASLTNSFSARSHGA